jgi:hypothetical protein
MEIFSSRVLLGNPCLILNFLQMSDPETGFGVQVMLKLSLWKGVWLAADVLLLVFFTSAHRVQFAAFLPVRFTSREAPILPTVFVGWAP